ncbi:hypothetical protein CEXT_525021 [Caerostris extrusa]|uniref:Uncharacterized protein n=1 Tax=Caerostris extrusa TaxID=172846 RepID=A0AAV4R9D8_CAEEX|nr:hypothetical protein CEXT_525021 [Caerostris extrusa]
MLLEQSGIFSCCLPLTLCVTRNKQEAPLLPRLCSSTIMHSSTFGYFKAYLSAAQGTAHPTHPRDLGHCKSGPLQIKNKAQRKAIL